MARPPARRLCRQGAAHRSRYAARQIATDQLTLLFNDWMIGPRRSANDTNATGRNARPMLPGIAGGDDDEVTDRRNRGHFFVGAISGSAELSDPVDLAGRGGS